MGEVPIQIRDKGLLDGWTHIDEADVELFGCVAPLKVPPCIDIIVPDDTSYDVRRGDPFGSLSGCKHSCRMNKRRVE